MSDICPVCNNPIGKQDSACAVCGFKLLGSTQSFQPVVIPAEEITPTIDKPASPAVLRVLRGPQVQMVFALEGDTFTIGRSPQCEIFLNDMTVSRAHAVIARSSDGFRINDTNSFNGVWINNKSVDSAVLKDGDIIQIGVFCLIYQEYPVS